MIAHHVMHGGEWCETLFFDRVLSRRERKHVWMYMRRAKRHTAHKFDMLEGLARRRKRMRRKRRT